MRYHARQLLLLLLSYDDSNKELCNRQSCIYLCAQPCKTYHSSQYRKEGDLALNIGVRLRLMMYSISLKLRHLVIIWCIFSITKAMLSKYRYQNIFYWRLTTSFKGLWKKHLHFIKISIFCQTLPITTPQKFTLSIWSILDIELSLSQTDCLVPCDFNIETVNRVRFIKANTIFNNQSEWYVNHFLLPVINKQYTIIYKFSSLHENLQIISYIIKFICVSACLCLLVCVFLSISNRLPKHECDSNVTFTSNSMAPK